MSSFVAIIPARQASSRLPGKMLADLGGIPMVVRVAQQALASQARRVVVACDHQDIAKACETNGIEFVMTRSDHPSGTDRLAQASKLLNLAEDDIVVNVQGDEPLMDPELINCVASVLANDTQASIATCAAPIHQAKNLFNANIVKVVCGASGHALYFSRAPIPWNRDAPIHPEQTESVSIPALHHIGIYAYRVSFLSQFPALPAGTLERLESLEQLRALEHGFKIAVKTVANHPGAGVDTESDLVRVRAFFENSAASG